MTPLWAMPPYNLRHARDADWCESQPHCKGNLGLLRKDMPQIEGKDVPEFVAWLEEKGISAKPGTIRVGDLQATQKEINAEKVRQMQGDADLGKYPILISKDLYVLDGHHRWAALLADDPESEIKVVKLGLPIKALLEVAHEFPKSFTEGYDMKKAASQVPVFRKVAWRWILAR